MTIGNFEHWERAVQLARGWVETDQTPAISCLTGSSRQVRGEFHLGYRDLDRTNPVGENPIYLVASITKPVVALGALLLIERGQLTLGERVVDHLPEFGRNGKYGVEIRHLLTHTSGLPDMLPNNAELRAGHSPLKRFVEEICEQPLAYPPGKGSQYQSMGLMILAEIMQRVSGRTCAQFLREEIFEPLGMSDTELGAPDSWFESPESPLGRVVDVRLTAEQLAAESWNWNSRYWRQLGAPWGGLLTTTGDLSQLATCLLNRGRLPNGRQLFSPAGLKMATSNQLAHMKDVPEGDRRCRPWGLGWRLNWPSHSANFGDLLGPNSYGHWGATGTVFWIDPDRDQYAIILSSQPQEPGGLFLARLSNVLAAAWDK